MVIVGMFVRKILSRFFIVKSVGKVGLNVVNRFKIEVVVNESIINFFLLKLLDNEVVVNNENVKMVVEMDKVKFAVAVEI